MCDLYRIQIGKFSDVKDAERQCTEVRKIGYDCILKEYETYYTCQIAVYSSFDDAKIRLHKLYLDGLKNAKIVR